MSQLKKNCDFSILENNRLNPLLLVGSNLASETAVTIFAHAVFQAQLPFTCEVLQDVRIFLCSFRCRDEAAHRLPSAQCSISQPARMCKARAKSEAHRADACSRSLATGVICQGVSRGSWINEGLALRLKMDMSVGNQNWKEIK